LDRLPSALLLDRSLCSLLDRWLLRSFAFGPFALLTFGPLAFGFAFGPFALLTFRPLASAKLRFWTVRFAHLWTGECCIRHSNSLLPTNEHNPQKFIEHRAPSIEQKKHNPQKSTKHQAPSKKKHNPQIFIKLAIEPKE